jgi:hypothetical protein
MKMELFPQLVEIIGRVKGNLFYSFSVLSTDFVYG